MAHTQRTASASWRQNKGSSTARGYGYRWQVARARFLARPENVRCVMCAERGRLVLATVVDHRIPHRGSDALFWDETNWQPLCKSCHDSDKKRIESMSPKRIEFGPDGEPVA